MNVVITGASRGIGRAIAFEFSKGYNHLLLLSKTNHKDLEVVKYSIEIMGDITDKYDGSKVEINTLDVTDFKACNDEIQKFVYNFGQIDYLINNAGIVRDRTFKNMTVEEWDDVINTNLKGIFNMTKACLPYMKPNGCIINITSIIGIVGGFGQTNYSASKAGVIGFTKSLAKEVAKDGIRVNAIACGYTDTDMTKNIPDDIKKKIIKSIPLQRFARPEEIAKTVRFICEEGTYFTGSVISIDGGLT